MQQYAIKNWQPTRWGVLAAAGVLLAGCATTNQVEMSQAQSRSADLPPPQLVISGTDQSQQNNLIDASPGRLVLAARYGQEDVVRYLLDGGMSVDAEDAYGNTALLAAAGNGQSEMVALLLQRGANINITNNEEQTALMGAAAKGDYQLVHQLIQAGAKVDAKNNWDETALFYAVKYGHLSAARVLLNGGANPNLQNTIRVNNSYSGFTPLMYAASNGVVQTHVNWPEIVALLLAGGADPNITNSHDESALMFALNRNDNKMASILKKAGAKDDQVYAGLNLDEALVKAARVGDSHKGEYLLKSGANANYVDLNGITPLLAASFEGRFSMVKKLVEAGAESNFVPVGLRQFAMSKSHAPLADHDLMAAASRGDTALIAAARQSHVKVVEHLIKQGAQIDLPNRHGETPLFVAADQGNALVVKSLLALGADPNTVEQDNRSNKLALARSSMGRDSVLIRASQKGHLEVVDLLLNAGADVNYRGLMGKTALYAAVENGQLRLLEKFIAKDADVGITSLAGITPLMEASKRGNFHMVRALLDKGTNVNAVERPDLGYASTSSGNAGMTALMFAAQAGHEEIVSALLLAGAQINIHNADGRSAISLASNAGYENIVRILEAEGTESAVSLFSIQEVQ